MLVHTDSYEPAVSYILLYLVSSVGIITAAVVVPLLPAEQFSAGICGSVYALYAAVLAMMVFFSGGVSSELYVMFFPLLLASALHGSWRVSARGARGRPVLLRPGDAARTVGGRDGPGDRLPRLLQARRRRA